MEENHNDVRPRSKDGLSGCVLSDVDQVDVATHREESIAVPAWLPSLEVSIPYVDLPFEIRKFFLDV
jgi:hypothetical protein